MSLQPTASLGAQALRAAQAYANADRADTAEASAGTAGSFGAALQKALTSAVQTGREADAQAKAALTGEANIGEVVTAIAKAELALQTTMAVRDRVVQAYQDIMRMPI